jgi:ketosteroid isomerase-like protein
METITTKKDENIRVANKAITDFLSGNIAAVVDACTEDVQWGTYDNPGVPYTKTYEGKKGVAQFFSDLGNSVDFQSFEAHHSYGDKDMVFIIGYQKGLVKQTGKIYAHHFLMQFRLREGKISNFFAWIDSYDQAEAFKREN